MSMIWLRPISADRRDKTWRLHLLPDGEGMVVAACGRRINRQFAKPDDQLVKCLNCVRRSSHV